MEDVVNTWHCVLARLKIANVTNKELNLACVLRAFCLILMTHIILLLFIAREDTNLSDIGLKESIENCITE